MGRQCLKAVPGAALQGEKALQGGSAFEEERRWKRAQGERRCASEKAGGGRKDGGVPCALSPGSIPGPRTKSGTRMSVSYSMRLSYSIPNSPCAPAAAQLSSARRQSRLGGRRAKPEGPWRGIMLRGRMRSPEPERALSGGSELSAGDDSTAPPGGGSTQAAVLTKW